MEQSRQTLAQHHTAGAVRLMHLFLLITFDHEPRGTKPNPKLG